MTVETAHKAPAGAAAAKDEDSGALSHVRAVAAASGSSFYLPIWLLPKTRRDGMFAVYAFCREIDDIADGPEPAAEKRARLAAWREEIERLFDGRPKGVIARALARPAAQFALRKEDFLALIDGMEMDAEANIRAPTVAELELYCARVAGAVGRLSVRVFGAAEPSADVLAYELGQALQLTNILRDLHEDAGRGRLYLPRELLDARGVDLAEPTVVLRHPALADVCADLAGLAHRRFANAAAALKRCPGRPMRPARAIMETYRRLLGRLERRGWERLDEPVGLSKIEKLWIALRHGVF